MLKGIKRMLGFAKAQQLDPIHAQIVVATQRNERAGEAARDLIKEVLSHADSRNRGARK